MTPVPEKSPRPLLSLKLGKEPPVQQIAPAKQKSEQPKPKATAVKEYIAPKERQLYSLDPRYREKILSRIAGVLDLETIEKLPPFFTTDHIRTAKTGIFEDLAAWAGIALEDCARRKKLRAAVGGFFGQWVYLESTIYEEYRYDLNLKVCGAIQDRDRIYATLRLKNLKKKANREKQT